MEISSLMKASFLSLAVMVAFLNTHVTSTPVSPVQAAAATSISGPPALRKCLESLRSRESGPEEQHDHGAQGGPESLGTGTSLASVSDECKNILGDFITDSGVEENRKLVSSFASSSSSGSASIHKESRKENAAAGTMGSSEGEQLPGQGPRHKAQPLSRSSRDIGAADREMVLRARGMVSRMMGAEHSTEEDGNSQGIPDYALLLTLARQHALAELNTALIRSTGQMDDARLVRLITQNPSGVLRPATPSEMKQQGGEDKDFRDALGSSSGISEEDSPFSQSQTSERNSDYPSTGRAENNNEQTPWEGAAGTASENDVMGAASTVGTRRYSRARFVQKRTQNTMSINNAMMAITNMLLAEQKERLQRNRQRIRQHMLIQG